MRIEGYPYEFARRAATILGSTIETSITVRQHGLTVRAGSSSDAAARCDQAEARADAGPCIDAMTDLTIHVVPDIATEGRWDAWREQALREGFATAIAVPALVGTDMAVALNLYSRDPEVWTPGMRSSAEGYAQLVAAMVRLQLETADLEDAAVGLYRNLTDAVVAERAVGAIMFTNACSEEEARAVLASAAGGRDISPREVAESVLRALVAPEPPVQPGSIRDV
ncbi:ANTAR domain-containing protein [Cellulomonas sp. PhB143]|uniref:ANTAR domain-containing protein n=1 Tax=Cellulomonas sp. PhB143 TaxID=2485186 RepID=UPI000F47A6D4|nr:ANTAR domain-containing protein [Cellulomonas sp. PhB143]ROS73314.1 hypothetical protein EDF32_2581 [Cellulomonas sp. PhB143]